MKIKSLNINPNLVKNSEEMGATNKPIKKLSEILEEDIDGRGSYFALKKLNRKLIPGSASWVAVIKSIIEKDNTGKWSCFALQFVEGGSKAEEVLVQNIINKDLEGDWVDEAISFVGEESKSGKKLYMRLDKLKEESIEEKDDKNIFEETWRVDPDLPVTNESELLPAEDIEEKQIPQMVEDLKKEKAKSKLNKVAEKEGDYSSGVDYEVGRGARDFEDIDDLFE